MTAFETYVVTELPLRPALIKAALEATGNPNTSILSKVQNSPIGTLYLQIDVTPKIMWQRFDTGATTWYPVSYLFGLYPESNELHVDATAAFGMETGSRYLPYTDIATAMAAAGDGYTIYIHSDVDVLVDTTLNATQRFSFLGLGTFSIAAGVTLTINGDIIAPRQQIFDLTATSSVQGLQEAHAEWFGFSTSASAADNAAALNFALASLTNGGKVSIGNGNFDVATDVVTFPENKPFRLLGNGCDIHSTNGTILTASGTGKLFSGTNLTRSEIGNFKVDGNSNTAASHFFWIEAAVDSKIHDLYLVDALGIAIYMKTTVTNDEISLLQFDRIQIEGSGGYGVQIIPHDVDLVKLCNFRHLIVSDSGIIEAAQKEGIHCYGLLSCFFMCCESSDNTEGHGIYFDECSQVQIFCGKYENNGSSLADPTSTYQIYFTNTTGSYANTIYQPTITPVANPSPPPTNGGSIHMSQDQGQIVFSNDMSWLDDFSPPGTAWYDDYFQGGLLMAGVGGLEIFGAIDTSSDTYPQCSFSTEGLINYRDPATAAADIEGIRVVYNTQVGVYFDCIVEAGSGFMERQYTDESISGGFRLPNDYSIFYLWLDGDISFIFPTPIFGKMITLCLRQGNPARTATFPGNVQFSGGSYTLTANVDKMDILKFQYVSSYNAWIELSRTINLG